MTTILKFNGGDTLPLRDFVTEEVTNVDLSLELPGSLNDYANEIFMLTQEFPAAEIVYQLDNGVITSQNMFSLSSYVGPPDSSVPVWDYTTVEIMALGGIGEEPLYHSKNQSLGNEEIVDLVAISSPAFEEVII